MKVSLVNDCTQKFFLFLLRKISEQAQGIMCGLHHLVWRSFLGEFVGSIALFNGSRPVCLPFQLNSLLKLQGIHPFPALNIKVVRSRNLSIGARRDSERGITCGTWQV